MKRKMEAVNLILIIMTHAFILFFKIKTIRATQTASYKVNLTGDFCCCIFLLIIYSMMSLVIQK